MSCENRPVIRSNMKKIDRNINIRAARRLCSGRIGGFVPAIRRHPQSTVSLRRSCANRRQYARSFQLVGGPAGPDTGSARTSPAAPWVTESVRYSSFARSDSRRLGTTSWSEDAVGNAGSAIDSRLFVPLQKRVRSFAASGTASGCNTAISPLPGRVVTNRRTSLPRT